MSRVLFCGIVLLCALATLAPAQTPPAAPKSPSAKSAEQIAARLKELRETIAALPKTRGNALEQRTDVEVFAKAAEWILRHNEFFKPSFEEDTLAALAKGMQRAEQLSAGQAKWGSGSGERILGYRSKVDGSVQPYVLTLPPGFEPGGSQRSALHVVLHGRGSTLNEVSFIKSHDGKPAEEGQTWIQLDVFGRTNNAYRWAGETDVFEALADVQRRYRIDDRRITLWGFSMGGAGGWHLGLQHPSLWSSAGAGAGFVDFYTYQKQKEPLPQWQDRTLRIYDTVNYALNLANVPFVGYGGEIDPQLAASLTMQAKAEELHVPLKVLVGPMMGHKFDDESKRKFMAFHAEHSAQGRPSPPGRREIRFTTCTLKYNKCDWLTIQEVNEVYEPSRVTSKLAADGTLDIDTENVAAFSIARSAADEITIDGGPKLQLAGIADGLLPDAYFVWDTDGWEALDYDESLEFVENPSLHKRHDLQGPIDDAFMQPFVCVRGTGKSWSQPLHDWSIWTLDRFSKEFDKWMRGKVRVVDDVELTDEQIAAQNLILFGDPGSNKVLARVLDKLPIEWNAGKITVAGKTYNTADHGVVLIYPNPLNADRYVVINSGHTMHEKDFKASNSWLFPKLGDIAVLKFEPEGKGYKETTEWAEIFDAHWKLP